MKKDEVLKQSREEKPDERKEEADNKAFISGMITVIVISLVLIVWNEFHDRPHSDISAIIASAIAVGSFVKYNRDRKIGYLIVSIAAAVITVEFLFTYFVHGV